jgi:hypothetical protein
MNANSFANSVGVSLLEAEPDITPNDIALFLLCKTKIGKLNSALNKIRSYSPNFLAASSGLLRTTGRPKKSTAT